ncbi:jg23127 [Pararge aegeria aegeria]|uniref:Jg23127 protein n=1 Tax=Pararge aegeria aegeria TaxID=348720 RepID=A0A8S4R384_9NEOP|nr:jg23127 [Pararge aegeria aegeria]
MEREFRDYQRDKQSAAKTALRQLLLETRSITHRSMAAVRESPAAMTSVQDTLKHDAREQGGADQGTRRWITSPRSDSRSSRRTSRSWRRRARRRRPPPPSRRAALSSDSQLQARAISSHRRL